MRAGRTTNSLTAPARRLTKVPTGVFEHLKNSVPKASAMGPCTPPPAAAQGAGDKVRTSALLGIVFKSRGLPEQCNGLILYVDAA